MGSHKKSKKTTKKSKSQKGGKWPSMPTFTIPTFGRRTSALPVRGENVEHLQENILETNTTSSRSSVLSENSLGQEQSPTPKRTWKQSISNIFSKLSPAQKEEARNATSEKTKKELDTKIKKFKRELLSEEKLSNTIIGMLIISDKSLDDINNNEPRSRGSSVSTSFSKFGNASSRASSSASLSASSNVSLGESSSASLNKVITIEETVKTQIRLISSTCRKFQIAVDNVLEYSKRETTPQVKSFITNNLKDIYKNVLYIDLQYSVLMKTCLLGIPLVDQIYNYQSYDTLESFLNENLTLYFYELFKKMGTISTISLNSLEEEEYSFYKEITDNGGKIKLNAFNLFLKDFLEDLNSNLNSIDNIIKTKQNGKIDLSNKYKQSVKTISDKILNNKGEEEVGELMEISLKYNEFLEPKNFENDNSSVGTENVDYLTLETITTLKKYVYTEKLDFFNEVFEKPCPKNLEQLFGLLLDNETYDSYFQETEKTTKDIFSKYLNVFEKVKENLYPTTQSVGGAYLGLVQNRTIQSFTNEFYKLLEKKLDAKLAKIFKNDELIYKIEDDSEGGEQITEFKDDADIGYLVSGIFSEKFDELFDLLKSKAASSIIKAKRHTIAGKTYKTLTNNEELENIAFKTLNPKNLKSVSTQISEALERTKDTEKDEIGKILNSKYYKYLIKKIAYYKARGKGEYGIMASPGRYLKKGLSKNVVSTASKVGTAAYSVGKSAVKGIGTGLGIVALAGLSLIGALGWAIKEYGPTGLKWLGYIIGGTLAVGVGVPAIAAIISTVGAAWLVYAILWAIGSGLFVTVGFSPKFMYFIGEELYQLYLYGKINSNETKEILEIIGNTYPNDYSERNAILNITAIKYKLRNEYFDELKPQFLIFDKEKTNEILNKLGVDTQKHGDKFEELFSKFKLLNYEAKKLQKLMDKILKIGLPVSEANDGTIPKSTKNKFEQAKKIKLMQEAVQQFKSMQSFFSEIEFEYFNLMKNILMGETKYNQITIFKNFDDLEKILNFTLTKCYAPICNIKYLSLSKDTPFYLSKIIHLEESEKGRIKNRSGKMYITKELHSYDMIIFFLFALNNTKIFSLTQPFDLFPNYNKNKTINTYKSGKNISSNYIKAFTNWKPNTTDLALQTSYAEQVTNMVLNEERIGAFKAALTTLKKLQISIEPTNINKFKQLDYNFYTEVSKICKSSLMNFIYYEKEKRKTFKETFFKDKELKGSVENCKNDETTLRKYRKEKIKLNYKKKRKELANKNTPRRNKFTKNHKSYVNKAVKYIPPNPLSLNMSGLKSKVLSFLSPRGNNN